MSDYSISGTVTPATANIVIFAENDDGLWITLTDDNGNYQCFVASPGLYNIGAFDFLGVLSGYFSNTFYSNVNVNGHITGYDFVFVQGNSVIEGVVTNQTGTPLEGLLVRAEYYGPGVFDTTDENGFYSLTVIEGFWEVGFNNSQLIPDFMCPEEEEIYIDDGETITVDFMLYETDSSISGTVYLDDVPYPGFRVCTHNYLIGFTETNSGAGGLYELSVSSAANSVNGYNLWIDIWDIPGVYVVEWYNNVMSGSTGLDFHIYTASGGVQGYIYDSDTLQPISYAGVSGFDNNNYYHTGSDDTGYYELFLPPGTYEIMVNANMYYSQNQLNVVVGDDFITIDFYLDQVVFEGILEGHVYEFGTTNPIAGAELMVSNNIFWANTTSDDTGYYYFDMPNGTFNLNAWHNNYYGSFIQGITISNNTVVQNVEMDPITFDGALEGYVYEVDSNTPIPFAHIEVFGIYSSSVMSDANGFYHIDLPNGGYSAICWKNGYFEDNLDWFEINNFTIINNFYLIPMSSSENLLTPKIVSLKNYPNPFYNTGSSRNSGTEFSFYLPYNSSHCFLEIYNLRGQHVITLTEGPLSQGSYSFNWNGSDRFHKKVSAGVYLYKLTIDDNQFMRKMLLIK